MVKPLIFIDCETTSLDVATAGYLQWMLGASFTKETKFQVAAILGKPRQGCRTGVAQAVDWQAEAIRSRRFR